MSQDHLVQMRLAHLNMIQAVIGRMATYSASVKTFCVTLVAAIIALTSSGQAQPWLPSLMLAIVLIFAVLDAYYLGLERAFRDHYAEVVDRDVALAADLHISARITAVNAIRRSIFSVSVLGFFVPLALILFVALSLASRPDPKTAPSHANLHPQTPTPAAPHAKERSAR
ncbi:MAG: hypothetical protein DI570_09795 [Phenylobacterium zucineum]|nr:MAG: hypothetical protein DI570_09795 [Phenylobacterium zucineum]